MWTSNISQKEIRQGVLFITVEYSNGVDADKFQETYEYQGGTITALDARIESRLEGLNALPDFEAQTPKGAYEPYSVVARPVVIVPEIIAEKPVQ